MHFYTPTSKKYPPYRGGWLTDSLFDAIEEKRKDPDNFGESSTQWIYLMDCLERQTITPEEARICLVLGHIPEDISVRPSKYEWRK